MKNNVFHVHNQVPVKHSIPTDTHKKTDVSFKEILQKEQLNISHHAKVRMKERNITLDETKWNNMQEKLKDAKAKGVTDSLVLVEDAALLVSVKNNTVITALDRSEMESKLITNINGAIMLD